MQKLFFNKLLLLYTPTRGEENTQVQILNYIVRGGGGGGGGVKLREQSRDRILTTPTISYSAGR